MTSPSPAATDRREGPGCPPPAGERISRPSFAQTFATALVVVGPVAGVVLAAVTLFGRGVTAVDLGLCAGLYLVTGYGVTAGFHRLLTHRSFKAARWLRVALAVCGSMAFEGSVIGWVAHHRRHHAYTDRPGDPHSPYDVGAARGALLRGAVHAHVGWLFQAQPTNQARWVPDLRADRDLVVVDRLFPVLCLASLGLPTLLGWAATGTLVGALGGLVWGGLVRVFLLHQSTFGINSACHLWGQRPFVTRAGDRATNFAPLAVLSLGENWHNLHHSCPTLARHGVLPGQLDSTARLIRLFEVTGAVWDVRWPDPALLAARRTRAGEDPALLAPGEDARPGDPVTHAAPAVGQAAAEAAAACEGVRISGMPLLADSAAHD